MEIILELGLIYWEHNQFILKIPNSSSNMDIKLGNIINVGWNSKDSRALDSK